MLMLFELWMRMLSTNNPFCILHGSKSHVTSMAINWMNQKTSEHDRQSLPHIHLLLRHQAKWGGDKKKSWMVLVINSLTNETRVSIEQTLMLILLDLRLVWDSQEKAHSTRSWSWRPRSEDGTFKKPEGFFCDSVQVPVIGSYVVPILSYYIIVYL